MTTEQLHEILDDNSKRLTAAEIAQVIYELKSDCHTMASAVISGKIDKSAYYHNGYYLGEANAFQIVLDLLEHLKSTK